MMREVSTTKVNINEEDGLSDDEYQSPAPEGQDGQGTSIGTNNARKSTASTFKKH